MLYLSRMDPGRDPKKTRLEKSEELKRRSLAQLGTKEEEDVVVREEVRLHAPKLLTVSCDLVRDHFIGGMVHTVPRYLTLNNASMDSRLYAGDL